MSRKLAIEKVEVEFLMSKAEYQRVLETAKRKGFLSVSEYIRYLLRQNKD